MSSSIVSIAPLSRLSSVGACHQSQSGPRRSCVAGSNNRALCLPPTILQRCRVASAQGSSRVGRPAAAYRGDEQRGGRPHDTPYGGEGPKVPAEPSPSSEPAAARSGADRASWQMEEATRRTGAKLEEAARESGMLSRLGYFSLSLSMLVAGIAAAANPQRALGFFVGSVNAAANAGPLHLLLTRLLASALIAVGFTDLAMFKAAQMDRLESPQAQRLNRGTLVAALAGLVVLYATAAPLTARATRVTAAFLVAHAVLALKNGGKGLLNPSELVGSAFIGVGNTLAVRTPRDLPLSLLTAALALGGVGYLLAPTTTLSAFFGDVGGGAGTALARMLGAGLLVLPFASYTQKDIWDHGEHTAQTKGTMFKILALALGAAAWGHLAALWPVLQAGAGGPLLPALAVVWGLGLVSAVQNFFAS